jgi:hypothetical protein
MIDKGQGKIPPQRVKLASLRFISRETRIFESLCCPAFITIRPAPIILGPEKSPDFLICQAGSNRNNLPDEIVAGCRIRKNYAPILNIFDIPV